MRDKISVVIPCYCSEKSITVVVRETIQEIAKLDKYDYEVILVNDCSPDNTSDVIFQLSNEYSCVIAVDLSKNCGQHNAIIAGMHYATGDYILGMDDDLQTHPSQIYKLINKIEEGHDIVYGKFIHRHHSVSRNLGSKLNDWTIRFLIGKPKDLKACPMYIIRKFVRDEIIKSQSSYTNLQGLFLRTSTNVVNCEIEHFDRLSGQSGYTLKKLIRLWSSFFNYTYKPIQCINLIGGFNVFLGIILIFCSILYHSCFIYAILLLLTGALMLSIGIVGNYVIRMFMIISNEPQYVVRKDSIKVKDEVLTK